MATTGPDHPEVILAPPRLLSRSAEAKPASQPIRETGELAAVRARWAQYSVATGRAGRGDEGDRPPRAPSGVRAKVKARVATAAAGVQAQDRALTGELVAALDAMARRIDELATRVGDLESLLQEVVEVTSEELVRAQVALGAVGHDPGGASPEAE